MRDAVYSARNVEEALRVAGQTLGVPVAELRYVVLDAGGEEQPARIAVLLDAMRNATAPARAPREPQRPSRSAPASTPLSRVERVERWFEALGEALGESVEVGAEDAGPEGLVIRVLGTPPELDAGEWNALERLLQRAFGPPRAEGRVTLEVPGLRESREARLREQARELAEAVRSDGEPRTTEPLNSYERRLIHIAVADVGGLVTQSEGEGPERAVVIRRADGSDD